MKTKTILIGIIVSVVAALTMTSCSQRTCPTYADLKPITKEQRDSLQYEKQTLKMTIAVATVFTVLLINNADKE